ncbi:MAG: DUF3592 domain-containing protein [Pirellulaceae bacterium]
MGIIGTIGIIIILYGEYKLKQASASVEWPVVPGRIVTLEVNSHTDDEGHTSYSSDIEYVYTVKGIEHQSDVVVLGGHEDDVHQTVARYPVGSTVHVSYDPCKASRAVLKPVVKSSELHELGWSMLRGSLSMATLFNFIIRRSMNEEKNLLDKILILTFKIIFFPLIVCKANVWALAGMVGLAAGLMVLELHPALTMGAMIFVAFYGIILVLLLWIHFMGWLYSLADKS